MSTDMAADVFMYTSDQINSPLNLPELTQSTPCCDHDAHEHSDVKVPTIFDAVKSGFVVMACTLAYRTVTLSSNTCIECYLHNGTDN